MRFVIAFFAVLIAIAIFAAVGTVIDWVHHGNKISTEDLHRRCVNCSCWLDVSQDCGREYGVCQKQTNKECKTCTAWDWSCADFTEREGVRNEQSTDFVL